MHKLLRNMWLYTSICVYSFFLGALANEVAHSLKPTKVLEDDNISLSIRRIKDPHHIHYLMQLDIVVYNHFEELSITVFDEDEIELCSESISPSKNQRTNCIFDPPSSLRSGGNALSIVMKSSTHDEVLFKTTYHFYYPYSLAEPGLLQATWNSITEKLYNSKEVIGFFGLLALSNYGIRRYNLHKPKVVVAPSPPNLPPSPPPSPPSSSSLPPTSSRGKPWFTASRSSVTASSISTVRVAAKPTIRYSIKNVMQQLLLSAPPVFIPQESTTTVGIRPAPIATSPIISLPAAKEKQKTKDLIKPKKRTSTSDSARKKPPAKDLTESRTTASSAGLSSFLAAILKTSKADAFPAASAAQPKKNESNFFVFLLQRVKEHLLSTNFKLPVSNKAKESENNCKNNLNNVNKTDKNIERRTKRRLWWKYLVIVGGLLLALRWPHAQKHVSVFFHEQEHSNGSVPIPPQLIKPPTQTDSAGTSSSSTAIGTSHKSTSQHLLPEKKNLWRSLVLVIAQALAIGFKKVRRIPISPPKVPPPI